MLSALNDKDREEQCVVCFSFYFLQMVIFCSVFKSLRRNQKVLVDGLLADQ
jgi:hypothetical protein